MMCVGSVATVMNIEHEAESWMTYWDDMSGKALNATMVEEARAEELAIVKIMEVWKKVDRE